MTRVNNASVGKYTLCFNPYDTEGRSSYLRSGRCRERNRVTIMMLANGLDCVRSNSFLFWIDRACLGRFEIASFSLETLPVSLGFETAKS